MAQYSLDFYAQSKYGVDVRIEYSVAPFTAVPTAAGEILLTWSASKEDSWTALRLVRNPRGTPGDADDGDVLLESPHEGLVGTYLDTGLIQGRYYYYTVFVAAPYPAWTAAASYQPGDCITYQGVNYICQAPHTGTVPGGASAAWRSTTTSSTWVRAGNTASLAVGDHQYAERMYQLLPPAYRTALEEITGQEDGITNEALHKYLKIPGFQYDVLKTELDNAARIRDQDYTSSTHTERAAETLGIERPLSARPVLRRTRVNNSTLTNRQKGSRAGIKQLIRDMTGWEAEIEQTPNLMVDQDQSGIWHPVQQEWQAGVRYAMGEYVTYGGRLYRAKTSVRQIPAQSLLPPSAVQSQGKVIAQTDKFGARAYAADFKEGDSFTLKFNLDTTATYDIAALYTRSYSYGIWTTALDGLSVHTFDGYSRFISTTTVNLTRANLAAGDHTLTFTTRGKNAASLGWQIGVNAFILTPTNTRLTSVPPSGLPDSALFWEPVSLTPRDWGLQSNATTLDPSTWWLRKDGAAARTAPGVLGIQTGMTPVTGSQYASTSLTFTAAAAESYTLASIAPAQTRPWNAAVTYRIGHLVTHAGRTWEATATASDGQEPGKAKTHWRPSLVTTDQVTPDASLVTGYGVPIPRVYDWTPEREYAPHDVVTHGRYRFEAVLPSKGVRPPGSPRDNSSWSFAGGDVEMVTASAHARLATGVKITNLACEIAWYDDSSRLMPNIDSSSRTAAPGVLYDRFDLDLDDVKGTGIGASTSETWTTAGGKWSVSGGAAQAQGDIGAGGTYLTVMAVRPAAIAADTTGTKPLTVSGTVLSKPADPLALQGIFFLCADPVAPASFYLAARDGLYRVTRNTGQYTATRLGAAYPEIKDGERLTVSYSGSKTISIKTSTGSGYGVKEILRYSNPNATDMVGTYLGFAELKRQAA